jgi:hypothetical protein
MRTKWFIFQLYLTLFVLEGFLALGIFLRDKSSSAPSQFFGYSTARIALGLGVVIVLVLVISALWASQWRRQAIERWMSGLLSWGSQGDRWLVVFISLAYLTVLGIGGLVCFQSPFFQDYDRYAPILYFTLARFETIRAILGNAWPLLVWGAAFLLQTVVLWVVIFHENARQTQTYRPSVLSKTLLVLVIVNIALLHAVILGMQMRVLTAIPGWYWDIVAKPFSRLDGVFLFLLALSLVAIWYVLNHQENVRRNLVVLFILGWVIQVGIGAIDGQGFESLRLKYANSHHRSHAVKASANDINIIQTVRNYEGLYGGSMFQSTKPPGTLLIYMVTRYVSDWISPEATAEGRFRVLTTFEAYIFPFVSFLVIFVLYGISRTFLPAEDRLLPSILYILLPNVILLTLFLDQVLYPLLFISGGYILIKIVDLQNFRLALFGGALLYLFSFFTFSMLPLIPFAFLYIAIDYWMNRSDRFPLKSLALILGIIFGFAIMFVLFVYALDYNAYTRYQGAMKIVRNFDFLLRVGTPHGEALPNTGFLLPPRYILSAFTLNNVEFASAIGFPVFLMFLVQGVITLVTLVWKKSARGYAMLASFFATYFTMNIFAPIQGEAARLWIFWAPVMVLFAGTGVSTIFKGSRRFIYLLIVLQLPIIYLTFKFQDLAP